MSSVCVTNFSEKLADGRRKLFLFLLFFYRKKEKKFADAQIAEKKLPTTVTQTEDPPVLPGGTLK